MSKVKKLLAVALAVVMAMALAVPALGVVGTDGSVTVKNVKPGEKYTIYKVLELDFVDNDTTKTEDDLYSYTIEPAFQAFFNTKCNKESATATDAVNYLNAAMSDAEGKATVAADLAKYVEDYTGTQPLVRVEKSVPGGANQVEFTDLKFGWYLTKPTFTDSNGDNTNEGFALFMLNNVNKSIEVTNKSKYPQPTKEVTDKDISSADTPAKLDAAINQKTVVAGYGDELHFEVKAQAPDTSGYKEFYHSMNDQLDKMTFKPGSGKLYIGDMTFEFNSTDNATLPTGITYVKAGDESNTTDGTYTFTFTPPAAQQPNPDDSSTFKSFTGTMTISNSGKNISIILPNVKSLAGITHTTTGGEMRPYIDSGRDIMFFYDATVDMNAVIGHAGNDNTVTVTYSNDPNHTDSKNTSVEDKTTTFILGLQIKKVDSNSNKLTGSEFQLKKKVGIGEASTWVTVFDTEDYMNGETPKFPNVKYTENELVDTDVNKASYNFKFEGLDTGEYKLIETKAPEGYSQIVDEMGFTITAEGKIENATRSLDQFRLDNPVHLTTNLSTTAECDAAEGMVSLSIKNSVHGALPSTGGAGLYIVAGVAIVALLGFGGTAMLKRKVNGGE